MVLRMTRPWKHPQSGIYWYRKRVPDTLRSIIGKSEEKCSLGTRDPQEAKIAHARVAAEVEARWAGLRAGVRTLTHKQAVAIAGEIYRAMIAEHGDDPGDPNDLTLALLHDQLASGSNKVRVSVAGSDSDKSLLMLQRFREARHRKAIEAYLAGRGLVVDDDSIILITNAVNAAVAQARGQLLRNAKGDYRPDPDADRFPKLILEAEPQQPSGDKTSSLTKVFDQYAKESGLSAATIKRWQPIIQSVADQVPDIRNLSNKWCIEWKNRLVASGRSNRTIQYGYLAALRATCNWAVANKVITHNPVSGIGVKVARTAKTRPKGFTDREAVTVLEATLAPASERLSRGHKAARRWLPWLCAYSGARVGEIAQLRGQDVVERDGVWLMWITPEAGTTKDNNARHVPIHPHLIEQGFPRFAKASGSGPLFYDENKRRGGSDANPSYKKVGERIASWVRSIGLDDPALQPNHAWRHRFKTVSRRVKMDTGTRDYMQGHAPANEAEDYGDFEPEVLLHEISKLPRYDV